MASRWLRGVQPKNDPTSDATNDYINNHREFNVFIYYFLRRILGYSHVDEVVAASRSFETAHSATGADGVLTNSTYTFNSPSAPFSAGDAGKYLVLVDAASSKNCGIHEILSFTDASNVTIDFYTTAGNYPDASTGITWFLLDTTKYPTTAGDYWVLETGHATVPCTIKGYMGGYTEFGAPGAVNLGPGLTVAAQPATTAWDAVGHAWEAVAINSDTMIKVSSGSYSTAKGRLYAHGNTDGSGFIFMDHFTAGAGNKQCTIFSVLDMFETGRETEEQCCLLGPYVSSNDTEGDRGLGTVDVGKGITFNARKRSEVYAQLCSYTDSAADFFPRDMGGPNARTSQRDALPLWVFADVLFANDLWAPQGEVSNDIVIAAVGDLADLATFDSDQFIHLSDQIVVPWPGIPQA